MHRNGIERQLGGVVHGGGEAVSRLFVEQNSCSAVDYGLGCAADAVGDHWAAVRHGLDRDDAKVLFARKEQRLCAAEVVEHDAVGLIAEELNVPPRFARQALPVGAFADHDQSLAQPLACRNRQVEPLVGHVLADAEVELLARTCDR